MRINEFTAEQGRKIDIAVLRRLITPHLAGLIKAIESYGFEVRVVGGAVRDFLLGREPRDVDLATDALPEELMFILRQADIDFVAKGIAHGTVKAIFPVDGAPEEYEITALGYAIKYENGEFHITQSGDWKEDARRRDFTINAMSLSLDGHLYDYLGGEDDLKASRVKMIGDPQERIKHDPALALRFFKALSFFKRPVYDPVMLEVIKANKAELKRIRPRMVAFQLANIKKGPSGEAVTDLMCRIGLQRYLDLAC